MKKMFASGWNGLIMIYIIVDNSNFVNMYIIQS